MTNVNKMLILVIIALSSLSVARAQKRVSARAMRID